MTFAHHITDPVLVLHGDADRVVSGAQVISFVARCPSAVVHTYAGKDTAGGSRRRPSTNLNGLTPS